MSNKGSEIVRLRLISSISFLLVLRQWLQVVQRTPGSPQDAGRQIPLQYMSGIWQLKIRVADSRRLSKGPTKQNPLQDFGSGHILKQLLLSAVNFDSYIF